MFLNLVQHFLNPRELCLLGLGQFQSHFRQRQVHGDEQLPSLVVHGVRDALDFLLERFVQLPQGLHRILKSTVCHLIRRQALREEFGARPEQFLPVFLAFRIANQSKYSLMMQGGHLHKALSLSECPTAEFIRATQCGFASPGRIFTQGRAVLVFKTRLRLRLASSCDLHGLIPVNRETRTSASSFPLRYCSRILSAALCGFSRAERVTEKSLRTPSVAKKSVSPCTIGSTVACRAGNWEPTTPARRRSDSCIPPFFASARINTPCTLPTPSQVIMPCSGSMKARLNTTPRVARSFSWHRSTREIIGWSAELLRSAAAALEALAASSPWPMPSIAATRIPFRLQQTRW